MNPREAAKELVTLATAKHIRFPKVWDEAKLLQTCGATLMLHRKDGGFNFETAIEELIEKYGVEKVEEESNSKAATKGKKRKAEDKSEGKEGEEEGDEEDEDGKKKSKPKGPKKTEVVKEERNRPIAEAIKEMADIYFKNKDMRKGGVFSKAAKALRECETVISSAKEAMALPGIGKGIAGYVEEFLQSGNILKLEELRAGTA